MPPKASANKIATAIAAVNRTVVRNVKAANRAVVKNYNAANRAINRAPAWVKWTIAAIAVAIIGYALWKVFFAPRRREGFDAGTSPFAPKGWHRYVYADIRHGTPGVVDVEYTNVGDHSISINDAKLGEFITKASTLAGCNAFSIYKDPSGSTLVIYKKIDPSVSGIQCDVRDDPNSVVMYVKQKDDGTELLKGVNCGYLQHKKLLVTIDPNSWKNNVDVYLNHASDLDDVRSRFVSGKDRKYNVKFNTKSNTKNTKETTLSECYRQNEDGYMLWKRIDPIKLSSELPLGYCYGTDDMILNNINNLIVEGVDNFTVYQEILPKSGAQLQQQPGSQKAQDASDATSLNAVNNVAAVNTGGCFSWPSVMINDKSGSIIKFGNNVFHYIDRNGNINTSYNPGFINDQSQNATFTFGHITYNSTIGKTLIYNNDKSKILKVHNPSTSLNLYHAYFVDVKNYTRVPGSTNESISDNNSFEFDVRKKIDSNEYQIKWDGMITADGPGTRYSFSTPSYDGQSYIKMMECTAENDISNTCTFYMRPSQIPATGRKFYLKDNTGKYFHATSFDKNRHGIKKADSAPMNIEDYFTYTYDGSDYKILNKDGKYMGFHVTELSNWIGMTDDGNKPNQFQIFPIKDSSKYHIRNNEDINLGDPGSFVHPWDESVEGGNGLTLKPNHVPYEWDIIWENL